MCCPVSILTAVCTHFPGRQVRLRSVRVKHVDILVKQQLYKLGRVEKFALAVEDAGGLLRRVHHSTCSQRENHHKGVLGEEEKKYIGI